MARLSLNRLTGRSCTVDTQSSLVFEKNCHSYPVVVSNWYVRSTPSKYIKNCQGKVVGR